MKIYTHKKLFLLIYFLFLTILFLNRTHFGDSDYKFDDINLFLSLSFVALCFIGIHLFLIENEKKNNFPFFPLILIFLFICYGLNYEFLSNFLSQQNQNIILKTFIILNLSVLFFGLGYFLFYKYNKKRVGLEFLEVKKYNYLVNIALFFLIINISNKFFNFIPFNLNQIIVPLTTISFSIIFYSLIKIKSYKNYLYLLILAFSIFLEILSSSYVFPATLVLIYLVLYIQINQKIPIIGICVFLLFFFTLHLFKGEFRMNLNKIDQNPVERIKIFFQFYSEVVKIEKDEYIILNENKKKKFLKDTQDLPNRSSLNNNRISHSFSSLVLLVSKTPSEIDYLRGDTYKILLSKIVPRIFWKDKPSDDLANKIGRKYKVLNDNDFNTSWNLPIINEAYINYGISGVIIITFILGIIVRLFSEIFSLNNFFNAESHIGVYLCCSTFFWEPHLSIVYGGIYYPIIFLYILMTILIFILNRFAR